MSEVVRGKIIAGKYFDSVSLMLVARDMQAMEDVLDAAAIMATAENKRILSSSNMDWAGLAEAGDTDLALGVKAKSEEAATAALEQAEAMLNRRKAGGGGDRSYQPRSLESALAESPDSNLALISVAGKYAADEARKALENGLNVMIFSDNVPLEDEIELKTLATQAGLLVMGPDCGTAIVGGVPLAFANVIRRGPIGLVAASGTGLQEVSSLIHQLGCGVSHALGTGGRDIKQDVGGRSFLTALELLKQDAQTKVVCMVSKTPSDVVLKKIAETVRDLGKPTVAIFIGADASALADSGTLSADSLEEAAHLSVALASERDVEHTRSELADRAIPAPPRAVSSTKRYLRGLFCGGTFAQEALHVLSPQLGEIQSNVHEPLSNPDDSEGHTIVDMGGDEFTAGRPHPMIDYSLRNRRMLQEAQDPEVGLILFDVVLGYGSNENPADELVPVLKQIQAMDDPPLLLFHVCGTDDDPQGRSATIDALQQSGAMCAPSNAAAASWAGQWLTGGRS